MSGSQVEDSLTEDVTWVASVGAEEFAEPEDEDELATADVQVREYAAVSTVDAIGCVAAEWA